MLCWHSFGSSRENTEEIISSFISDQLCKWYIQNNKFPLNNVDPYIGWTIATLPFRYILTMRRSRVVYHGLFHESLVFSLEFSVAWLLYHAIEDTVANQCDVRAVHDGKFRCKTAKNSTAFLCSHWLYFLWYGINISIACNAGVILERNTER